MAGPQHEQGVLAIVGDDPGGLRLLHHGEGGAADVMELGQEQSGSCGAGPDPLRTFAFGMVMVVARAADIGDAAMAKSCKMADQQFRACRLVLDEMQQRCSGQRIEHQGWTAAATDQFDHAGNQRFDQDQGIEVERPEPAFQLRLVAAERHEGEVVAGRDRLPGQGMGEIGIDPVGQRREIAEGQADGMVAAHRRGPSPPGRLIAQGGGRADDPLAGRG